MKVVSFYRFADVPEPARLRAELQPVCEREGLLGTILVAEEGVNGTLAGTACGVQAVFDHLEAALALSSPISGRWTAAKTAPFRRLRVRVRNEVVALGRPDIRPQNAAGTPVPPRDWNRLIGDPETLVIDTRNQYEIELGSFPRAVNPGTDCFRQFGQFAESLPAADKERSVAMFCTGGIRCEKASALLKSLGFARVHQLQGGILNYLEQIPEGDRLWQGECFVFDSRVAVDRDLADIGAVLPKEKGG